MDKSTAAAYAIKLINMAKEDISLRPTMIDAVCTYFDLIKGQNLSSADRLFMHYLANQAGVPQYYHPMLQVEGYVNEEIRLQTLSNYIQESSLMAGEGVTLHRYQKEILDRFQQNQRNRYFLSASTSFGKTFLIYEILRKMKYRNIALIFPTISLLSENLFKIYTSSEYQWIKECYDIHTLSEMEELGRNNLFIYTPERFLSFLDKSDAIELDFVFVDEVYKLDNGFIIDEIPQENERDIAYRIALYELLKNDRTDALLVGPYIIFPKEEYLNYTSSFKAFLDRYKFIPIDYNNYDIVSKKEITINQALKIDVENEFKLEFSGKSKTVHVIELVKQLLDRNENTIIYCSQKYLTEKWAKDIINNLELIDINNDRIISLTNHIGTLFAEGKGAQWIVAKALKKGIGIHHGLVPKYIQQEIISLFNDGILKILICTTTITEGVNTTAKNMIVLSGKKGTKDLKKFDALNIEGRAGRFMSHYKGRVFILDNAFTKLKKEEDVLLRHKFFDKELEKNDVDLVFTDSNYLTNKQENRRRQLNTLKDSGIMPKACFEEFRTISYDDKIHLYNTIERFSASDHDKIKELIRRFVSLRKTFIPGLELVCQSIRPIIKNQNLRFYVENGDFQRGNCYLVDMISAFIYRGFSGSANYYIKKEQDVDKGIRKAANFVFSMLRYQVVKYFGLFNLLYKQYEALKNDVSIREINGIDALLLRLEYGADTQLGRRASDIGASFRVIRYYDIKDNNSDNVDIIEQYYNQLDEFERYNVHKIDKIL